MKKSIFYDMIKFIKKEIRFEQGRKNAKLFYYSDYFQYIMQNNIYRKSGKKSIRSNDKGNRNNFS